jgi:hypothetical protein
MKKLLIILCTVLAATSSAALCLEAVTLIVGRDVFPAVFEFVKNNLQNPGAIFPRAFLPSFLSSRVFITLSSSHITVQKLYLSHACMMCVPPSLHRPASPSQPSWRPFFRPSFVFPPFFLVLIRSFLPSFNYIAFLPYLPPKTGTSAKPLSWPLATFSRRRPK